MKKSVILIGVIAAMSFVSAAAFAQAQKTKINETIPFVKEPKWIPCALGGEGEFVDFRGNIHLLSYEIIADNGNVNSFYHVNPTGMTGTGLTSGITYRGCGVDLIFNKIKKESGIVTTTLNVRERFISPGPGNNLTATFLYYWTGYPDGTIAFESKIESVECR